MKTLQELTLFDRFLFNETMEIPEAHEAVLRIILGDEKLKLLSQVQTEKEMQTAPWLRSIRLDTFSMDQDKTIYNTESQKRRNTDLIKRSRFYQGVIDSSLLAPGTRSFNLLNDTCIIMITPFDLFGKGRYCYTFHPYCEEEPDLRLEDGAVRIFLNSHGTNRNEVSEELVALLEYMETMDADKIGDDSENLKKLHEYVEQIKASEEIGVKYMQKWEELEYEREDAREEGLKQGLMEGREEGQITGRKIEEISVLRRLLKKKNRDEETVADDLDLSLEYVHRINELLSAYPMESDEEIVKRIVD